MNKALFYVAFIFVALQDANAKNILALVDSDEFSLKHSKFFAFLQEQSSNNLTVMNANEMRNINMDTFPFDALVIMCPTYRFQRQLKQKELLKLIDTRQLDTMIFLSSNISKEFTEFGYSFDLEFDRQNNLVFDNYYYSSFQQENHVLFYTNVSKDYPSIISPSIAPIIYKGIGINAPQTPFITRLVRGSEYSYTSPLQKAKNDDDILVTGNAVSLVVGVQFRNNNRMSVFGSIDIFSNHFLSQTIEAKNLHQLSGQKVGNEDLMKDIVDWTFHKKGKLRVVSFKHEKIGGVEDDPAIPFQFTINDTIRIEAKIEEFKNGKWINFVSDSLMVSVGVINPYIQKAMKYDAKLGKHVSEIQLPDRFGVYTLRLRLSSNGIDNIEEKELLAVRPKIPSKLEDGELRPSDMPYYVLFFSSMVVFVIFCLCFLFVSQNEKTQKEKSN